MSYLKISSKRIELDIEFTDKYIIVEGDSGVGKTLMVELLSDEEFERLLQTDLTIHVLNKLTQNDYANWHEGLIVCDETYARKYSESFKQKNCSFLIVSRKNLKKVNYSYRSLYQAYRENEVTRFKRKIIFTFEKAFDTYDYIVTEDSGYGYKFIKQLLDGKPMEVIPAGGKSNLAKSIDNVLNDKTLLVIADAGGIGSDIEVILNHVRKKRKRGAKIQFLLPDCFEHVLLCSNYYEYDVDILKYSKVEFNDTEKFCEQEIARVTKGTALECDHDKGVMSSCWYKSCNNCTAVCDYRVEDKSFNLY